MYQCEICGKTTQPHTPAYKVTTEVRSVIFPFRSKVYACWKLQPNGKRQWTTINDPGGIGRQIVREATACPDCYRRLAQTSAARHIARANGKPRR